jgi:hypothetical protein
MTVVDELNRDISQIRSKRARAHPASRCKAPDTHRPCAHASRRAHASASARARLVRCARAVNELTQDHGRHLLPGFNDEDDKEVKIQQSAAEITSLFKHCERQMKALSAENRLPGAQRVVAARLLRVSNGEARWAGVEPFRSTPRMHRARRTASAHAIPRALASPSLSRAGHTGAGSDDIVRKNILATAATQLQELHFQFRRQQKTYLNSTPHRAVPCFGRRQSPAATPARAPKRSAAAAAPTTAAPRGAAQPCRGRRRATRSTWATSARQASCATLRRCSTLASTRIRCRFAQTARRAGVDAALARELRLGGAQGRCMQPSLLPQKAQRPGATAAARRRNAPRLRGRARPLGASPRPSSSRPRRWLALRHRHARTHSHAHASAPRAQLLESNERQIAERNAAVETIMTSVVELSEIFKEIHVLVIDQGTLLDRIDYNIEQASEKVGGAVKELESVRAAPGARARGDWNGRMGPRVLRARQL